MILYISIFVFGLIIGSFLNVCICRMPEGRSVVTPSSRCTSCGSPVKFYDNIPVISYILLAGKCRNCKTRLSIKYPLIELLNAVLYILVLNRFGISQPWVTGVYLVFVSALVVIFFIDLEHQIIPDSITLPGIPAALIVGSLLLPDPFTEGKSLGFQGSFIGFLAGGGFFYLAAVAGKAILKKDAMGGGDIKMMAMVGGLLGWKGVFLTTFIGSLVGTIVGLSLIIIKGREWGSRIPFGPYLASGAVVCLLLGNELLSLWLRHLNAG